MTDIPKLNAKHKKVVDLYLADPQRLAYEAYKKVYPKLKNKATAQVNASRLFERDDIQAYIKVVEDRVTSKTEISVIAIRQQLNSWRNSKLSDYYKKDENNNLVLKDFDELTQEQIDCIQEITPTKDGYKIRLIDKESAAVNIGRHLGMFTDNVNLSDISFADGIRKRKEEQSSD